MSEAEEKGAQAPAKTLLEIVSDELTLMKTAGIIEVAVRNPSVAEYMNHWEGRALRAEAGIARLGVDAQRLASMRECLIEVVDATTDDETAYQFIERMTDKLNATADALGLKPPLDTEKTG